MLLYERAKANIQPCRGSTWCNLAICIVVENIWPLPWRVFFVWPLPPTYLCGNFSFVSYFHWKNLSFETPTPLEFPLMPLGLGYDMLITILFSWCSPKTFDINTAQLAEEYKKLQWKLHPDKFSDLSKVFCAMKINLYEGYFQNVKITNSVPPQISGQ